MVGRFFEPSNQLLSAQTLIILITKLSPKRAPRCLYVLLTTSFKLTPGTQGQGSMNRSVAYTEVVFVE